MTNDQQNLKITNPNKKYDIVDRTTKLSTKSQ